MRRKILRISDMTQKRENGFQAVLFFSDYRKVRFDYQNVDFGFSGIWYNNEENGGHACMNRHLTSISIETLVEMVQ